MKDAWGTPQWGRPLDGRMTLRCTKNRVGPAAMEPADGRPDDDGGGPAGTDDSEAAMEPADKRPDDDRLADVPADHGFAAMEPADERPDDNAG